MIKTSLAQEIRSVPGCICIFLHISSSTYEEISFVPLVAKCTSHPAIGTVWFLGIGHCLVFFYTVDTIFTSRNRLNPKVSSFVSNGLWSGRIDDPLVVLSVLFCFSTLGVLLFICFGFSRDMFKLSSASLMSYRDLGLSVIFHLNCFLSALFSLLASHLLFSSGDCFL